MFYLYILQSLINKRTYVGITDDLTKRLSQHNSGSTRYTKRYIPWKIIYQEEYLTREEAARREKYFKSCTGRKWMKKNLFCAGERN